jgi:hypothetical protein
VVLAITGLGVASTLGTLASGLLSLSRLLLPRRKGIT